VDRDTLIHRWYVHRIRLDSEGTARQVRIGTEAFARPTEWFALHECEMSERGLSTPAVERIVKSRGTAPPSWWPMGRARRMPAPDARAQGLLRRLADARRVDAVVVVRQVARELTELAGSDQEVQGQVRAAVADAHAWLETQAGVRRELFHRLEQAAVAHRTEQVRELLVQINATAAHDRTATEDRIAGEAADYLAARREEQQALQAERAAQEAAVRIADRAALGAPQRVRRILRDLGRRPRRSMTKEELRVQVELLVDAVGRAGKRVTPSQMREIERWKHRVGLGRPGAAAASPQEPARDRAPSVQKPATPGKEPSERSAVTIAVWVWKDRYGGLHTADHATRPEATVRYVPLPRDPGSLRRLHGNLTRMIAEREAAEGPVHGGRASMSVRVWETSDGDLVAALTRRRGAAVFNLPLPGELGPLRELYAKVEAQMQACKVRRP
jgi:hypothetical protein